MRTPAVSILLPCLNAEATVDRAVASIVAQSWDDWELICGDDASSDGTLARLEEWARRDRRIKVFAAPTRRRIPRLLNDLIDIARGPYLARQDADDVSFPQRIECQVRALDERREVDLLGAWMIDTGTTSVHPVVFVAPPQHSAIVSRPYQLIPVYHPTFCGRSAWFRHYRYDPRIPNSQDQELLLRAHRESCFANVAQILVGYTERPFRLIDIARRRAGFLRPVWRDALEHDNLPQAAAATASHAAALVFNACSSVFRKPVPPGLRSHTRFARPSELALLSELRSDSS